MLPLVQCEVDAHDAAGGKVGDARVAQVVQHIGEPWIVTEQQHAVGMFRKPVDEVGERPALSEVDGPLFPKAITGKAERCCE